MSRRRREIPAIEPAELQRHVDAAVHWFTAQGHQITRCDAVTSVAAARFLGRSPSWLANRRARNRPPLPLDTGAEDLIDGLPWYAIEVLVAFELDERKGHGSYDHSTAEPQHTPAPKVQPGGST